MDGQRQAQMGEASVYEAKLHAQTNASNLRLLAGPRKGCSERVLKSTTRPVFLTDDIRRASSPPQLFGDSLE